MQIDWMEDDSGFSDCCNMGQVFFYDLQYQMNVENQRLKDLDFSKRQT